MFLLFLSTFKFAITREIIKHIFNGRLCIEDHLYIRKQLAFSHHFCSADCLAWTLLLNIADFLGLEIIMFNFCIYFQLAWETLLAQSVLCLGLDLGKLDQNFTCVSQPGCTCVATRRDIMKPNTDAPPPITPNMTKTAMDLTKPTSCTGPDGISYRHLKHLGPVAIKALTDIFNHSILHNTIPNIWKIGKIITILKQNKSPIEPASYRPISYYATPSKYLRGWFNGGFVLF